MGLVTVSFDIEWPLSGAPLGQRTGFSVGWSGRFGPDNAELERDRKVGLCDRGDASRCESVAVFDLFEKDAADDRTRNRLAREEEREYTE